MTKLKVDTITNKNDNSGPTFTYGMTVPAGQLISGSGGINVVGVISATSFVGDGSNLGSYTNPSKGYAIKLIIDPLPFRS